MRKSASEVIRNLERRIARLERQAGSTPFLNEAVEIMVEEARGEFDSAEAHRAIIVHLDYLSEEEEVSLRTDSDYDRFAKKQYRGNALNLAMVADQYIRGAF